MGQAIVNVDMKIHVLCVEDSRVEAMACIRKIEEADDNRIEIHHVDTLKDALSYIEKHSVDAVLLDLGLPDSDGACSIRALNKKFPDLPVVVLSGREDEVMVLRAFEYGAQEFLLKGECSGMMIRQSIFNAMFRKSLKK